MENENQTLPPTTPQETAPEAGEDRAAAALAKLEKMGGDRTQINALKEKLGKLKKTEEKTTSGSEAPDSKPEPEAEPGRVLTGKDVDWSEYDLDFNLAHLYPKASFRETPQGPKWVVLVIDFHSTTKDYKNYEKKVNAPGSVDKAETEHLNLGLYLNDMVNGREAWHIEAVTSAGTQCGILLSRQIPIVLPDPQPLKKSEEVAPPTDPQLAQVEDAALAFAAETGTPAPVEEVLDTEAPVGDDTTAAPIISLRPIEKGTAEHEAAVESLEASGAVMARHGEGVARALATAAPETIAAPTAGIDQPEPVVGNDLAVSNLNPEGKVAAAGYSAAQDLLRALNDPNFRASLPQEE